MTAIPSTLNGVPYEPEGPCADCGRPHDPEAHVWTRPTFLPGDWNGKVTLLCGTCEQKPENRTVSGVVCSFDKHVSMADVEACEDCTAAKARRKQDIQDRHTIDPSRPYGEHIALTCRNHPELRWSTKNIDNIGARSIFYSGFWDGAEECSCPLSDLVVVK